MSLSNRKKILVAGGGGFIGSHLCEKLLEAGNEVWALDNFVTGQKENLKSAMNQGLNLVVGDITDLPAFSVSFDQIYNLASPASPVDFGKIPIAIAMAGSLGQYNLLKLAQKTGARILFASSSEVYGDALVHPQVESYFGNTNSYGPRSPYDEAKRFGEAISIAFEIEHGMRVPMARIFNTYGPRMRLDDGRIIPNFFTQALRGEDLTVYGDGTQTRSFCFVDDLVNGLMALMNSNESGPFNLGNPIEKTVKEMAQIVLELTGNKSKITFMPLPQDDPKQRCPNISKATSRLNWKPEVSLSEGLRRTHDFFRSAVK